MYLTRKDMINTRLVFPQQSGGCHCEEGVFPDTATSSNDGILITFLIAELKIS